LVNGFVETRKLRTLQRNRLEVNPFELKSRLREYYGRDYPDYSLEDIIGSPYAVVDYSVNPEIGTDADVINLKKKFHQFGLKLMTDFVPNHSAVDCKFFVIEFQGEYATKHPDYFVQASPSAKRPYSVNDFLPNGIAYGKDPYSGGWIDTIQWNGNYWSIEIVFSLESKGKSRNHQKHQKSCFHE
jgi:hypothetical protein